MEIPASEHNGVKTSEFVKGCPSSLFPVPPDTEHSGWTCTLPDGHLVRCDHLAEDGTTW
ncbi:hypothetical protein [Amycolatopsis sp. WAC 04197]|uniref:hypothetical protein n=1 Tax=Amycolatopsis sp. WAC 04197 TaxID=2203199 RepID=UPI001315A97E|nr:hypothetical protein [Amycolatopsis sp. WAC 04197]